MKQKLLTIKSLLVAVGLFVGQGVWAQTIGSTDYSTGYLGAKSVAYAITEDGTWTFNFINHNSGSSSVWNNWLLECNDGTSDVFVLRADNYEVVVGNNTNCTTTYGGSDLVTDINGASVNMVVKRDDDIITVTAVMTPISGSSWTNTYTYDCSANTTLNLYLSVDAAYLCLQNARWAADGYITTNILSENYETYAAGDIESYLTGYGWTFQARNNVNGCYLTKNCVQGAVNNLTKYLEIAYYDGANRRQIWDFNGTNALTTDNWTLTFAAAFTSGSSNSPFRFAITGKSSTIPAANGAVTNPIFSVDANENAGTVFTAKIGNTSVKNDLTLSAGTWYQYTIKFSDINIGNNTATIYVKVTSYDLTTTYLESTQTNVDISGIGNLRGIYVDLPRTVSKLYLDDILLTKNVLSDICANPTYTITGPSGEDRKFTLSCETDGATIYYATTDLAKGDAGWNTYSSEVTTDAATIYAYAEKGSATSDIINFATGAGTAITLNAPTLTKTAYSAGKYTVSITSDQTNLSIIPTTHVIKYSIDGGAATTLVSSPIQIAEGSTVSAYVELSGYTTSSTTECVTAARPTNYATSWTQDYTNITSASGNGAYGVVLNGSADFNVDGTDMKNIIGYTYNAATVPTSLNTNVGLSTSTGFSLRCNGGNSGILKNSGSGYLGIQNLKVGDVIVITTSGSFLSATYGVTLNEGMCTNTEYYFTATETEASIAVSAGTYNYIKDITVLSSTVPATIGTTGYTTFACSYPLNIDGMTASTGTVKAYYVTASDVKSSSVALTEVTGNVAAGTGLILEGTADATITIPVVASGTDYTLTNKLVGCTVNTDITASTENYGNFYVLSATEAAFKKIKNWVDVPNTLTIPAGKAYLDTTGANVVGAPTLTFDLGGVTAITNTNCTNNTNIREVYNLNGQRVAQPTKGLYIVNGKKIIIK